MKRKFDENKEIFIIKDLKVVKMTRKEYCRNYVEERNLTLKGDTPLFFISKEYQFVICRQATVDKEFIYNYREKSFFSEKEAEKELCFIRYCRKLQIKGLPLILVNEEIANTLLSQMTK